MACKPRAQMVEVANNPLDPCGACMEWLKKIAEVNPDFKVGCTDLACLGSAGRSHPHTKPDHGRGSSCANACSICLRSARHRPAVAATDPWFACASALTGAHIHVHELREGLHHANWRLRMSPLLCSTWHWWACNSLRANAYSVYAYVYFQLSFVFCV